MATSPTGTKGEPTKLRDSCNACAVSKIKCTKEKPVCARCARRGQRCEYFATRRAGRKHEPRQQDSNRSNGNNNNNNNNNNSNSGSDTNSSTQPPPAVNTMMDAATGFTSSWDVHMSDDIAFASPSNALCTSTPALPADDSASWRMISAVMPDAGDLFASQMSFSMPETPNQQLFSTPIGERAKSAAGGDDNASFDLGDYSAFLQTDACLVPGDTGPSGSDQFQFPPVSDPPSSPSLSSPSPSSSVASSFLPARKGTPATDGKVDRSQSNKQDLASTAPSGCCLIRALELLKKLFPGWTACTCTQNASVADSHGTHNYIQTFERVITENKQTIEAVQGMLQCPCSDADRSYLLAVISLVVFKVLGWYRAAVQDLPVAMYDTGSPGRNDALGSPTSAGPKRSGGSTSGSHSRRRSCHVEHVLQAPAVIDGYRLDGDDQARMAAQLVLSELHRVQRLINLLASRLKAHGEGDVSRVTQDCSSPDTLFFSQAWFGHLETDLRKRVRALSLEIVKLLRQ